MNAARLCSFRHRLASVSEKLKVLQQRANEVAYEVTVLRDDLLLTDNDNLSLESPTNSAISPPIIDVDADDDGAARSILLPTATTIGKY